jgi:hypothetical protein
VTHYIPQWADNLARLWVNNGLEEVSQESDRLNVLVDIGKLFGNKEMRILMLGLDAAGKTSEGPASLRPTAAYR